MNENKIVGYLPREISRATKFLLDRGANSPLPQIYFIPMRLRDSLYQIFAFLPASKLTS